MTIATTPVLPAPPTLPEIPSALTPTTLAALVGSFAAYVLGVLTYVGVVLPPSVSAKVQAIIGLVTLGIGAVGSFITMLSHHSVQKAAYAAIQPDVGKVTTIVHNELERLATATAVPTVPTAPTTAP